MTTHSHAATSLGRVSEQAAEPGPPARGRCELKRDRLSARAGAVSLPKARSVEGQVHALYAAAVADVAALPLRKPGVEAEMHERVAAGVHGASSSVDGGGPDGFPVCDPGQGSNPPLRRSSPRGQRLTRWRRRQVYEFFANSDASRVVLGRVCPSAGEPLPSSALICALFFVLAAQAYVIRLAQDGLCGRRGTRLSATSG